MTIEELKFASSLVSILAALAAWFFVKWIEKRLGCESDWDMLALATRNVRLLWQKKNLTDLGSATSRTCARVIALTILALCVGTFWRSRTVTFLYGQQERSSRIHEILQEAQSYQAADAKIRGALQEILGRHTTTFPEFERQCADLQTTLAESDAMDKKKRKMLADLHFEFRDDSAVQPTFNLLFQLEDVSDKVKPIWRGMIACSGMLASATRSKQEAYQTACVDPAHQQLSLLVPEMNKLGRELQAELQKHGDSLPRDFLQVIGQ